MRYYQRSAFKKIQGTLKYRIEASMADGITCISPFLVEFYKQNGVKEKKLFLLPSTVVASRFQKIGEKPVTEPYVGYFGGLSFERDNIDLLIKAFAQVSNRHVGVRLVLGGFGDEQDREKIRHLINELNIGNRTTLLELLPRQEVTRYITHADLLVMVRRKDLLSQASFPSKLSEFLATANPVVAVKVGDVSSYLTDNENAFLVEPEDPGAMAEKLDYVLTNYDHAQKVGRKGHELTTSVFSHNYQVKRLLGFIDSLKN
jgi:glycosyltransferase involved in cell wall biosynthesis